MTDDKVVRKRKGPKLTTLVKNVLEQNVSEEEEEKPESRCFTVFKWMLLLLVIPPVANYAAIQTEWQRLRDNDALFDIGFGQKLYMSCRGTGRPTILLDAPTGQTSDLWYRLQEDLSQVSRVCVWDRAGLGFSDPPPSFNYSDPGEAAVGNAMGPETTSQRMVNDLHRLVTFAYPQDPPFILVGSELGALNAMAYALKHREHVAQVVLIDPVSTKLFEEMDTRGSPTSSALTSWHKFWWTQQIPSFRLLQFSAMLGLNRFAIFTGLIQPPLQEEEDDVDVRTRQRHFMCSASHLGTVWSEHVYLNASTFQVQADLEKAKHSADLPACTVITGNYYDELLPSGLNRAWSRSAQHVMANWPNKCQHLVINGADHHVIHRQPVAIAQPIRRMIKQISSDQPKK